MVGRARLPLDPVADLDQRLARSHAGLRTCVTRWWREHGLVDHPAAVGKRIALALVERRRSEAGIFVLSELLADELRVADLPAFARLFAEGHLADAIVADGFAVRVLGKLLGRVRGRAEVARRLVEWREAETVWQRRAACVAFGELAAQADAQLSRSILTLCASVLWSIDRQDQTAVGRLLCALSRAEPARVGAFFRRHARLMSRECAKLAVERLPDRDELLAHHRRATTIRVRG
jgi:hypothetical protein